MQPADHHSEAGNQHRQILQNTEYIVANAEQVFDTRKHKRDYEIDQNEHPVFRPACPSAEYRIFPRYFQIPVHVLPRLLTTDRPTGLEFCSI